MSGLFGDGNLGGSRSASVPFSGTADASGNYSTQIRPRGAYWFAGKMVGKVSSGLPIWEAFTGALPAGFSRGTRAEIGGILLSPGDTVTITLTGCTPGASVQGQLLGLQGATQADVVAVYNPVPNTLTIDVAATQMFLKKFLASAGPQSIKLPPGTHAIALQFGTQANVSSIQVTGDVSGSSSILSFVALGGGLPQPFFVPVISAVDTSVTVRANLSAGDSTVNVSAIFDPEVIAVLQEQPIAAYIFDQGAGTAINTQSPLSGAGSLLGVSEQNAKPAPWQAPASSVAFSSALASGASSTIVAAVGGQKVYLHHWENLFSAVAAASYQLQDTTPVVTFAFWNGAALGPFEGDGKGIATATGLGLRLFNGGGVSITGVGSVHYTQQ
jgi:hypothetical protein